MNEINVVTEN